jgi:SulP family sulfate permease
LLLPRDLKTVRGDIYGGLTAAVVALPLALAFGVASGVGAIAGLYGAIAVGFFAAIFGGTNSQVSGPTGPMTVVMAVIVTDHAGNLGEAFAIVFLGGAIQVLFGTLRIGRFISYTPYPVVSGFMSGIGVIIIMIQVLPFFGLATVQAGRSAHSRRGHRQFGNLIHKRLPSAACPSVSQSSGRHGYAPCCRRRSPH